MTKLNKSDNLLNMKKLQLNTDKIIAELKRIGKDRNWLAEQLNTTRQNISYMFLRNSLKAAEKIGHVLNIEPKDLIK